MQNHTRVPSWLIGSAATWLAYAILLSALHLRLLSQWGVSFTLQIYTVNAPEPLSLTHILLLGMVAPGFFILEALSFLHVHIPWLDAAIYNWRTMVLLSSLPAIVIGALLSTRDRRLSLAGTILGLSLFGGSLLFILNHLLER
ncbi:MAG: hypothetical protein A2030_02005 [Chloroflexi bacterium RBG_19FT_COMBO_50_10]|nr:MAG: hypothetical protein A2030_02005 [Chloroflexi bacterium RBG_19FT_COMBO_50_10]